MGEADLNPRQPAAARSWLLNWGDVKGQKTWENKNLSSDQKMPSLWVRSKIQKCANQKEKHGQLDVKLKSFQREKSFDPDKVERSMVPIWRAFHNYEQFSFSGKSLSSFSTSNTKGDSMIDPQNKIRLCIHPDQWVSNFRTTGEFVKAQPSGTQPRPACSIGLGVGSGLRCVDMHVVQMLSSHRGQLESTGGSDGKESACTSGDPGLIPGSERSPGAGHGNPLQYSWLKNSMDRGALWTTIHGITMSQTPLTHTHTHTHTHTQYTKPLH